MNASILNKIPILGQAPGRQSLEGIVIEKPGSLLLVREVRGMENQATNAKEVKKWLLMMESKDRG